MRPQERSLPQVGTHRLRPCQSRSRASPAHTWRGLWRTHTISRFAKLQLAAVKFKNMRSRTWSSYVPADERESAVDMLPPDNTRVSSASGEYVVVPVIVDVSWGHARRTAHKGSLSSHGIALALRLALTPWDRAVNWVLPMSKCNLKVAPWHHRGRTRTRSLNFLTNDHSLVALHVANNEEAGPGVRERGSKTCEDNSDPSAKSLACTGVPPVLLLVVMHAGTPSPPSPSPTWPGIALHPKALRLAYIA
jgi:hypothetical protein